MGTADRAVKRAFDVVFAFLVLVVTAPVVVLVIVAATIDTRQFGVFTQIRIGLGGRPFRIFKVRTMRSGVSTTNITTAHDSRITPLGSLLRRSKLDELPQFANVLVGDMSVVGPRPDVPGYADQLDGDQRHLLALRPGVTGPAAIYFRDEEELLAAQANPQKYNDNVLWPAKVALNLDYLKHYSFAEDLRLILDTALPWLSLSQAARQRDTDA